MGLSASQIRLLNLTARTHDIEYRAQYLEAQKLSLATDEDRVYQKYCDALDATKIQIRFANGAGATRYIDANFSTVCGGYDPDRKSQYVLKDADSGFVIVDSDTKAAYEACANDRYGFAWYLLGLHGNHAGWGDQAIEDDVFKHTYANKGFQDINVKNGIYMTSAEYIAFKRCENDSGFTSVTNAWESLQEAETNGAPDSEKAEKLKSFREKLYANPSFQAALLEVLQKNNNDNIPIDEAEDMDFEIEKYDNSEMQYYFRLFDAIQEAGGCTQIDSMYMSGAEGNEWFNNMVSSGDVLIEEYNTKNQKWTSTSVATSTSGSNLQEVSDDTDLKKAEAEYNHEVKVINRKETKMDQELKELETERSALTTEAEGIKQVKQDNIDRTYNIFG